MSSHRGWPTPWSDGVHRQLRPSSPDRQASAAVDALHEVTGDDFAEVDRSRGAVVEYGADSITAGEVDANERTADAAGAA